MNLITSSLNLQLKRCFFGHNSGPFLYYIGVRKLTSPSFLGLDDFLLRRTQIQSQFAKARNNFINVLKALYLEKKNNVSSSDIQNMIFICEKNENELKLIQYMIRNFIPLQDKYGSQRIGLDYLRLLHILKLPNEMRKVLDEKELSSMFNQLKSYAIAMSLFYNYKLYKDVLDTYYKMTSTVPLNKITKVQTILALASCYHMNSSWSLQEALSIISKQEKKNIRLDPRSLSFAAALALKQEHTYEALELTSKTPWNSYVLRNIKVLALIGVGREEDTLPILRGYSGGFAKHPSQRNKDSIFLLSTMKFVEKALSSNHKNEALSEFNIIKSDLQKNFLIKNISLEEALTEPIEENSYHRDSHSETMMKGSFERSKHRSKAQKKFNRVGFNDFDQ